VVEVDLKDENRLRGGSYLRHVPFAGGGQRRWQSTNTLSAIIPSPLAFVLFSPQLATAHMTYSNSSDSHLIRNMHVVSSNNSLL